MKTQRLAFSQLHQELQVLERETIQGIMGGYASDPRSELYSSIFGCNVYTRTGENGQLQLRFEGSFNWANVVFQLDEVVITGAPASMNLEQYGFSENPFNMGSWTYSMGSGSGGGTGSNFWSASALVGYTGMVFEKNNALLTFTANEATTLADVANAQAASRVFVISGKALGVVGSVFTAYEGATDSNGFTWGDGLKVGIGLVATFTPYGWAYAIIDLGTGMVTGTTLTDHLGNALDEAKWEE